jgi:hypothetical protein
MADKQRAQARSGNAYYYCYLPMRGFHREMQTTKEQRTNTASTK